jgi:hypothetical protein
MSFWMTLMAILHDLLPSISNPNRLDPAWVGRGS